MSTPLRKSIATFALAFLAGIVGAVFGWIVTGFAADAVLALPGKLEDLKIDLETKKNTMPGIWEGLGRRGKDGGREDNCFRQRRSLFPLVVAFPRVARAGSAGPALQAETREQPQIIARIRALAAFGFCR